MTREELDSLMNGEPDISEVDALSDTSDTQEEFKTETIDPNDFRVEADKKWPPPPPTEDHKVVHQLDEVTQDTEAKGIQIFDQLEIMSNSAAKIEKEIKNIKKYLLYDCHRAMYLCHESLQYYGGKKNKC